MLPHPGTIRRFPRADLPTPPPGTRRTDACPVKRYDAIVIGGGHNGLVTAAYLARAGLRTVLLEKNERVGGATYSEEIRPGFTVSVFSYVVSLLRPQIIDDLNLAGHGLQLHPLDGTFTPLRDGRALMRWHDPALTRESLLQFSRRDADNYPRFGHRMHLLSRAVRELLTMRPPRVGSLQPGELSGMARLARHFASLGDRRFHELARLMTASSSDYLDRWFETEPLKATMAASGIIGTFLGIRSPGTAYVLLHHYMGEIDGASRSWGFAQGGMGSVAEALASSARWFGAEIRTGAGVSRILTRNGRATGVVLEDGEEITGKRVASSLDPRLTFLRLLPEEDLPGSFVATIRRYRLRGSSGKVNLALDGLPDFTAMPGPGPHLQGAISISPDRETMDRAYDDAKYGKYSREPYLDVLIPSLIDPTLAPPGRHVMSIFVQYAPYALAEGAADWDNQRDAFGDAVIRTLAQYAPNLPDLILERQVLTPLDIERRTGLGEGNIFQGELGLDQLFFLRPAPGWAQFRTPLTGLFLCGSGAHPGGGVMGAPGKLAADAMIGRRRSA